MDLQIVIICILDEKTNGCCGTRHLAGQPSDDDGVTRIVQSVVCSSFENKLQGLQRNSKEETSLQIAKKFPAICLGKYPRSNERHELNFFFSFYEKPPGCNYPNTRNSYSTPSRYSGESLHKPLPRYLSLIFVIADESTLMADQRPSNILCRFRSVCKREG